ncbi:MAG TPA: Rieske 2Fe-2S domain-containing protein [Sporichthyaceae bacterium]
MSDNHNDDGRGPHSDAAHPNGASHELALPIADPFADPGLPHHLPRRTDVDERAAKRAERQVSALFTLSTLCTIGFVACYVGIDKDKAIRVQTLGRVNALNFGLGLTLGGALLCIGVGAIHWARKLMNSEEIVDYRHPMKSSARDTADVLEMAKAGAADSALPRRKMIWMSLAGAMAAFPITLLVPLRDLGPLPHKRLRETLWQDPNRRELVHANGGARIKPADLQVGSLVSAKPSGTVELEELAKASIMLIRIKPEDVASPGQLAKSYQGIMAFSKICPHAGCPLGLYEQSTHHMLCPCHQSTFDLSRGGKVIFGPAARNLPQLAIAVNAEGYLVAERDFDEPVGPSFWERG